MINYLSKKKQKDENSRQNEIILLLKSKINVFKSFFETTKLKQLIRIDNAKMYSIMKITNLH